jgi:UrcA family protein
MMNIQGGTMRIRDTLNLAVGAAMLLLGAANIASAASVDEVRSVRVRYDDILINTELGNTVLYRRIVSAAVQVCGSPDMRDLNAMAAAKTCRRIAVERAVESVHSQRLAALIVTGDPLLRNPW